MAYKIHRVPYRMPSSILEAAIIRAAQTDAEIAIALMRCYKALLKRARQRALLDDIRAMRVELKDERVRLDRIAEAVNNLRTL